MTKMDKYLIDNIYKKIGRFERITKNDAIKLFEDENLLVLGKLAQKIRFKKHPNNTVTFILDTNINYTNICTSKCLFCAFYRNEQDKDAYVLSIRELEEKIHEAEKINVTTALIQGGLNPNLPYSYYLDMIEKLTKSNVYIHAFSPPEIDLMCKVSNKSIDEVFSDLKQRGFKTMPGGGAEILSDHIRKTISPSKITSKKWLEIMEKAHKSNIITTATMMFGHIETYEDVVEHLDNIRKLQDKTHGFRAFISWDFKKENTVLGKSIKREVTGVDYLKMIAISRIFLDNIDNIQASWASQGEDVGSLALYFGANDMGSMLVEENVMAQAGFRVRSNVFRIASLIKKVGFRPALRTTDYKILKYLY